MDQQHRDLSRLIGLEHADIGLIKNRGRQGKARQGEGPAIGRDLVGQGVGRAEVPGERESLPGDRRPCRPGAGRGTRERRPAHWPSCGPSQASRSGRSRAVALKAASRGRKRSEAETLGLVRPTARSAPSPGRMVLTPCSLGFRSSRVGSTRRPKSSGFQTKPRWAIGTAWAPAGVFTVRCDRASTLPYSWAARRQSRKPSL